MEAIEQECRKIVIDVMSKLEKLEGTEHGTCVDDVRIELTNRLEDLKGMMTAATRTGSTELKKENMVLTQEINGKVMRVCFMSQKVTGKGIEAVGAVAVTWGEKTKQNMGVKVVSNVVNQMTARMWGIIIAAGVAEARKYPGILIVEDNPEASRRILEDLAEGRLDQKEEIKVLVGKLKELRTRVEIRIAKAEQKTLMEITGRAAKQEADKLVKATYEKVKKNK